MSTDRQRDAPFTGTVLIGAALCGAYGLLTSGPGAGLVYCLVSLIVAGYFALTRRGGIIGAALFAINPSVIGEASLQWTALAAAVILATTVATKAERPPPPDAMLPIGVGITLVGVAMLALRVIPEFAVVYLVLAIAAVQMLSRPQLAAQAAKAVALIVGALTVSYLVTWATGFPTALNEIEVGSRVVRTAFPVTLTGSGTPLWESAPPRLVLGTGEPGLNVFYMIPVFCYVVRRLSGFRRLAGLVLFGTTALMSQSAGMLAALAIAFVVYAVHELWSRRRHILTILVVLVAILVGVNLVQAVLQDRASRAPATLTDRGLAAAGGATSASEGNINILVSLQRTPTLGLALIAALGLIALVALRSVTGAFAFLAFAVTAAVAQPSQWQAGGWFMLVLAVVVGFDSPTRGSMATPTDRAPSAATRT